MSSILRVVPVACVSLALAVPVAHACVPDARHCSVSSLAIALEGSNHGAPDVCSDGRCGEFTTTVRDFADNLIPGASVTIDFSGCPDVRISCDQLDAISGQHALAGGHVAGTTNAAGQFTFRVLGAANATRPDVDTAPGTRAGVPCAVIYADGVLIANLTVAAYDIDGLGSPSAAVNAADVSLVMAETMQVLRGGTSRARDDYNGSGSVNSADLGISLQMALQQAQGTGSSTTAPFCP